MDEKMTKESLKQFFQMASQDQELQSKLKAAPNREAYISLIVELGKEKGYMFTKDQVVAALDAADGAVADTTAREEELLEEDLEKVAGGFRPTCIAQSRGETDIDNPTTTDDCIEPLAAVAKVLFD